MLKIVNDEIIFVPFNNAQKVLGYVYFCAKQGGESGAYLGVCEELNDRRFVQKEACHRTFFIFVCVSEQPEYPASLGTSQPFGGQCSSLCR